MNTSTLWLGIIPIIAFIILDSFTEKRKALVGALILGMAEVGFTVIKFGALDYLTALAIICLAVFVGVSIKTNNDLYFKIQGAVVNTIFGFILISAQYIFNTYILVDMTKKYIGIPNLIKMNPMLTEPFIIKMLTALNTQMPWWFFAHSILTVYAAIKWNKWIWAVIRVPGFYLMLALLGISIRFSL